MLNPYFPPRAKLRISPPVVNYPRSIRSFGSFNLDQVMTKLTGFPSNELQILPDGTSPMKGVHCQRDGHWYPRPDIVRNPPGDANSPMMSRLVRMETCLRNLHPALSLKLLRARISYKFVIQANASGKIIVISVGNDNSASLLISSGRERRNYLADTTI